MAADGSRSMRRSRTARGRETPRRASRRVLELWTQLNEILLIMQYMKQLLIEAEDEVPAKLEKVAPGRARRRSEFVRNAIRRALWELEEAATAEAYRENPDSAADA